jgi:hypothetical protein
MEKIIACTGLSKGQFKNRQILNDVETYALAA